MMPQWEFRKEKQNGVKYLQCSCMRNRMDREAWRATVHGAAKELDMTE